MLKRSRDLAITANGSCETYQVRNQNCADLLEFWRDQLEADREDTNVFYKGSGIAWSHPLRSIPRTGWRMLWGSCWTMSPCEFWVLPYDYMKETLTFAFLVWFVSRSNTWVLGGYCWPTADKSVRALGTGIWMPAIKTHVRPPEWVRGEP